MSEEAYRYSNGTITVHWRPERCTHSTNCWRGLPRVFQPRDRPWVKIDGAESERIAEQVGRCPSGALQVTWNADAEK
ncbi:MAG: (4Fe-4S)-binding protein [Flavobacteriales bacterium]|nr:(4Fe-4S)-binding protein [Flavobacteriales bacterium]